MIAAVPTPNQTQKGGVGTPLRRASPHPQPQPPSLQCPQPHPRLDANLGDRMSTEQPEVALARIEATLEGLRSLMQEQIIRISEKAHDANRGAEAAHRRLDRELDDLRSELISQIAPLSKFRERLIGIAVGLAIVSGGVSGTVVAIANNISQSGVTP